MMQFHYKYELIVWIENSVDSDQKPADPSQQYEKKSIKFW